MSAPATLVLAVLRIESSYAGDVERPARDVPDTVQFWLAADGQWTIRTHAADHDIRVHRIAARPDGSAYAAEQAEALIEKHYADVTARRVTLAVPDPCGAADEARISTALGLGGCLFFVSDGWSFYNPDRAEYRPRSAL